MIPAMILTTLEDLILPAKDVFLLLENGLLDFLVLVLIHILAPFLNGFQIRKLLQNDGNVTNMATSAKSQLNWDINDCNSALF